MITTSGRRRFTAVDHVLAVLDRSHELKVGGESEHEAESLPHRRVIVHGETAGRCGHHPDNL